MSVPSKNTTWGKVTENDRTYGVLDGFHLSDEILEKYERYSGDKGCIKSTAPWATTNVGWRIENDRLYLIEFCKDGLLPELTGKNKLLADWLGEMKLLVTHRRVCKTYEKRGSYLNKMEVLCLTIDKGKIVKRQTETELYTSIEIKEYMDAAPSYATLRMDSEDLMTYLEMPDIKPAEDMMFPIAAEHIAHMLQANEKSEIRLGLEDVKAVLKHSDVAVMGSVKGSDIEEMVEGLMDFMTDGVLKAKGCLVHLTAREDYPMEKIATIVNGFEERLGFDGEDPAEEYTSDRDVFIFGSALSSEVGEGEVLIRVLLGI